MTTFQAIIIAIVEGITEFLPISSTYHMKLTSVIMGIKDNDEFIKLFIESIQFGAILSVIVLYWRKFLDFTKLSFYYKIIVAFIPAAIVGFLLKKHIEKVLGDIMIMTIITFLGGFLLLFVDKWFNKSNEENLDNVSYKKSFSIGLFQLFAIILPGFSRSAATIIGGMQQKLSRKLAAEFSFFLAVPTLAGAFVLSIWDAHKKNPEFLRGDNLNFLIIGNLIAFIVAMIAIKGFIAILTKYGFKFFGYYRIIMGAVVIVLLIFHIL